MVKWQCFTILIILATAQVILLRKSQSPTSPNSRHYEYSVSSVLVVVEATKLIASLVCYWVSPSANYFRKSLTIHAMGLAVLYSANNLLQFYLLSHIQGSMLYMAKSTALPLTVFLHQVFGGQQYNFAQLAAVGVQFLIVVVAVMEVGGHWSVHAYLAILSGVLSALTATLNANILNSMTFLNSHAMNDFHMVLTPSFLSCHHGFNSFLYGFGCVVNVAAYFFLDNTWRDGNPFFHGWTGGVIAIVIVYVITGFAVTSCLKAHGVFTKCTTQPPTAILLVIVEVVLLRDSLLDCLGVLYAGFLASLCACVFCSERDTPPSAVDIEEGRDGIYVGNPLRELNLTIVSFAFVGLLPYTIGKLGALSSIFSLFLHV